MRIFRSSNDNYFVNNAYFFGKHGSATADGRSIKKAVLTAAQAQTLAAAQSPTTSNRFVIISLDNGVYSENYTSQSWIDLYMPNAKLDGTITVAQDTIIRIGEVGGNITVNAGKVLWCDILIHSSGSVTKNGTIRGRIGNKLWGISDIEFLA